MVKKKIIIPVIIVLLALVAVFFYILFENPYSTEKIRVMDCEYTYRDYYFDDWSLRDAYVKPQPTTAFGKQFAEKEVGQCLYKKYFETLDPAYKTALLQLFKGSEDVFIKAENFDIDINIKNRTGLNQPANPIDFNQFYLE